MVCVCQDALNRLEDHRAWDHRILIVIGVPGDIKIFVHDAPRLIKKRPVRADAGAKLIRLGDVVGGYRGQNHDKGEPDGEKVILESFTLLFAVLS